MLKPRNRLINFRVTEEEYEELKTACETRGARCLSDFARSAILQAAAPGGAAPPPAAALQERLGDVERRIETIESNLGRLLDAVTIHAGQMAVS